MDLSLSLILFFFLCSFVCNGAMVPSNQISVSWLVLMLAFAQTVRLFSSLPVHVLHPTFPFHPKATTTHTHTTITFFFFSILTCPCKDLISFPKWAQHSVALPCLSWVALAPSSLLASQQPPALSPAKTVTATTLSRLVLDMRYRLCFIMLAMFLASSRMENATYWPFLFWYFSLSC